MLSRVQWSNLEPVYVYQKRGTMNVYDALAGTACSFGIADVLPNYNQLVQWTINMIMSGNKAVLQQVNEILYR